MAHEQPGNQSGDPDNAIERITANTLAHYEPFGWHHWPQSPWFSYQFRRGLGETEGIGKALRLDRRMSLWQRQGNGCRRCCRRRCV